MQYIQLEKSEKRNSKIIIEPIVTENFTFLWGGVLINTLNVNILKISSRIYRITVINTTTSAVVFEVIFHICYESCSCVYQSSSCQVNADVESEKTAIAGEVNLE